MFPKHADITCPITVLSYCVWLKIILQDTSRFMTLPFHHARHATFRGMRTDSSASENKYSFKLTPCWSLSQKKLKMVMSFLSITSRTHRKTNYVFWSKSTDRHKKISISIFDYQKKIGTYKCKYNTNLSKRDGDKDHQHH